MSVDVRGLVFVGTRTPAAGAMSAFVRDVLGLQVRGSAGTAFFDLPDGSSFAVQPTQELDPAERTVGFLVDDLDAALAELRAAGVVTDEVAQTTTARFVHFRARTGGCTSWCSTWRRTPARPSPPAGLHPSTSGTRRRAAPSSLSRARRR